jgi:hypothetical protein
MRGSGDGIAVTELAGDEIDAAIAANRHPDGAPIALDIQPFEFAEWARAGGVARLRQRSPIRKNPFPRMAFSLLVDKRLSGSNCDPFRIEIGRRSGNRFVIQTE